MAQTWEKLSEQLFLLVSEDHTFGTDAFLLAQFAHAKKKDHAVDLGTGCGIIPFVWHQKRTLPAQCIAVDIQPKAIDQCTQSVDRAGLTGQIIPICADLKDLKGKLPFGQMDLITCNPPYKIAGGGILSELDSEKIARHETMCTLEDICRTAAKLLKFGGRLCMCQRPERLTDLFGCMRLAGIEPKRMQTVHKNKDSAPWLVLVEGKRGAKPFLSVEPPFFMFEQGSYTEQAKQLYRTQEEQR